jgi:hypothetical protein
MHLEQNTAGQLKITNMTKIETSILGAGNLKFKIYVPK